MWKISEDLFEKCFSPDIRLCYLKCNGISITWTFNIDIMHQTEENYVVDQIKINSGMHHVYIQYFQMLKVMFLNFPDFDHFHTTFLRGYHVASENIFILPKVQNYSKLPYKH